MPTYRMVNPETGEAEDVLCTISDMEVLKQQGWVHVLVASPNSIIRGRTHSGQGGGMHTSDSWKDTLRRIKDNHPHSTIDV